MFVIKCMHIKISFSSPPPKESEHRSERNIERMFVASCFCEFGWMERRVIRGFGSRKKDGCLLIKFGVSLSPLGAG